MSETKNIKKMKAVRLHAIGDLRCDEMEVPVPKGEELLIKVGAVYAVPIIREPMSMVPAAEFIR